MDTNTINLLERASIEIKRLRKSNQEMGLRLDMFDKMWLLFTSQPRSESMGTSEDVCYQIEKHIKAEEEKCKRVP